MPTEDLHQTCDAVHDGDENADTERSVGNEAVLALLEELRKRHLRRVKDETGDEQGDEQNEKDAFRAGRLCRRGLGRGFVAVLDETVPAKKQECHTGKRTHDSGNDERGAPAKNFDGRCCMNAGNSLIPLILRFLPQNVTC